MNILLDDSDWTEADLAGIPRIACYSPSRYDNAYRVHRTVELNGIEIDERIAPLIDFLWRCGIETSACCQGHALDYHISEGAKCAAYVLFKRFEQAVEFVKFTGENLAPEESTRVTLMYCQSPPTLGEGLVNFPPLLVEDITEIWRKRP